MYWCNKTNPFPFFVKFTIDKSSLKHLHRILKLYRANEKRLRKLLRSESTHNEVITTDINIVNECDHTQSLPEIINDKDVEEELGNEYNRLDYVGQSLMNQVLNEIQTNG